MALTYRDVRGSLLDAVFARGDLSKPMPKYKFPKTESLAADAFQVVQDELFLDGNARQNLATFRQTWEEAEVHKIMDLAIAVAAGRNGHEVVMVEPAPVPPINRRQLRSLAIGPSHRLELGACRA